MLTAVTRDVSPSLGECELTWVEREPIDVEKARAQHRDYERCLRDLGCRVVSLPALPEHPDAVFVEDPALVLDEVALITPMGCESRRGERASLAAALAEFRAVKWMREGPKLEGGDVMRIDRDLFVGLTARTDEAGIAQLALETEPLGYRTIPVELDRCLHLKSACSWLGEGAVLIHRGSVDAGQFPGFRLIDVDPDEPGAANVLQVNGKVLMPASFPATAARLRAEGFEVHTVDVSELLKAESGVTCSCLLFR